MNGQPNVYLRFRQMATIALAALVVLLIALPFAVSILFEGKNPIYFKIILLTAFSSGALIGYLKRNSRFFLYLCMLAVIILSVTMSFSIEG